ncbi:hypothetical protein FOA52_002808 [Chlamydomonas sp. UWO 241]|nr:hypothetical protein FOA52_002808 [Chlamydomonas sp. UWO 241]
MRSRASRQAAAPLLALLAACCLGGSWGQGPSPDDFSGPGLGGALPGVPSYVMLAAAPPSSLSASDCALVGAILRNFHPGAPTVTLTACAVFALPAQPSVSVLNYTVAFADLIQMGNFYTSLNNAGVWSGMFNALNLGCGSEGTYTDAFNGTGPYTGLIRSQAGAPFAGTLRSSPRSSSGSLVCR